MQIKTFQQPPPALSACVRTCASHVRGLFSPLQGFIGGDASRFLFICVYGTARRRLAARHAEHRARRGRRREPHLYHSRRAMFIRLLGGTVPKESIGERPHDGAHLILACTSACILLVYGPNKKKSILAPPSLPFDRHPLLKTRTALAFFPADKKLAAPSESREVYLLADQQAFEMAINSATNLMAHTRLVPTALRLGLQRYAEPLDFGTGERTPEPNVQLLPEQSEEPRDRDPLGHAPSSKVRAPRSERSERSGLN